MKACDDLRHEHKIVLLDYAMPRLKGIEVYDSTRGTRAFWTMNVAMMLMGLSFGVAGVLQAYLERVLGMGYMVAESYMRLWMGVTFFLGLFFLGGVATAVFDLFTLRAARASAPRS